MFKYILLFLFLAFQPIFANQNISYLITDDIALEDVIKHDKEDFKPYVKNNMGFGFTSKIYWLKVELENTQDTDKTKIIALDYPTLNKIDVYETQNQKLLAHEIYGNTVKNTRKQILPYFIHKSKLEPKAKKTYYIKVQTQGPMILELTIEDEEKLYSDSLKANIIHFLYYGLTLGLILYNLFLFFGLRDKSFLYYVLFHISFLMILLSINGFGTWLIWGSYKSLNLYLVPLGMILVSYFGAMFFNSFVDNSSKLIKYVAYISLFSLAVPFIFAYKFSVPIAIGVSLTATVSILFMSIYTSIKKDNEQAKYFVIAWSGLLIGAILLNLKNAGFVPVSFFTTYSAQIGAAFELILLSIALIQRYTKMQNSIIEQSVIIKQQEEFGKQLLLQSQTDSLTGIFNRRYFFDSLNGHKYSKGSVLVLDLDLFKNINDTFGHDAGDETLKGFTKNVAEILPSESLFCRFGGEEFVILLPDYDSSRSKELAQKILERTREINLHKYPKIRITVSIGIALLEDHNSIDEVLNKADEALYKAKQNGRDRFESI